MRPRRLVLFGSVLILLLAPAAAFAWPEEPPQKVIISGPGIHGEVVITDPALLAGLQLGGVEDFAAGAIPKPPVSTGYTIQRFFDGAHFNFGRLTYYPDPAGGRGYLYFEDGPHIDGHTPYHQQWLRVRAGAEAVLQRLLATAEAPAGGNARATGLANRTMLDVAVPAMFVVLGLAGLTGLVISRRRRRKLLPTA